MPPVAFIPAWTGFETTSLTVQTETLMTKVRVAGFSVSLDGFAAGTAQSLDHPLGVRGEEFFQWFFPTRTFREHSKPVPCPALAEKQEWGIPVIGGAAMTDRPMVRTGGLCAAE
jgi:hypothetical protein